MSELLESMKENPSLSTMWAEGVTMINDEKSER
jgi:hypothetical protein